MQRRASSATAVALTAQAWARPSGVSAASTAVMADALTTARRPRKCSRGHEAGSVMSHVPRPWASTGIPAASARATRARPSWPPAPSTRIGAGGMGVTSASIGWARSLSESAASSSGMGQAMAAVGSARLRNVYWPCASADQWSFTR